MRRLAFLALAFVSVPLAAQTAPADHLAGKVEQPIPAGTYSVEPGHTQVIFAVSHMGITPFSGTFSDAGGSLTIDPASPGSAALTVQIPISSVHTTSDRLTDELKSADWFDAAKFPTASFKSSRVTMLGTDAARIEGQLTLHGVTRPVTMTAKLFGATANAMTHAPSLGFVGKMMLRRSEFGVSKYVPLVSDDVELVINAAFEKGDPAHAKN